MSARFKKLAGGLLLVFILGFVWYSQSDHQLFKLGSFDLDRDYLLDRVELAQDYGIDPETALKATENFNQYYQISRELGLEITKEDLINSGYYLEQKYQENILFRANTFKKVLDTKIVGLSKGQYQGSLFVFPMVGYNNQEGEITQATTESKEYALSKAQEYRKAIIEGADPDQLIEQIKLDPKLALPMAENSSRMIDYTEQDNWQNNLGAYHEEVIEDFEDGIDVGLGEIRLAHSYRNTPDQEEEFMYYFTNITAKQAKDQSIIEVYQDKLGDNSLVSKALGDTNILPTAYADVGDKHQATTSKRNQLIASNPRARLFGDVQGQVLGSDNQPLFGAIVEVSFEIQESNCLDCDWAFVRANDILTPDQVAGVKNGTIRSEGSADNEYAPRYKQRSVEVVTDENGYWSLSSIGLLADCNTSGGYPPTKIKYKGLNIFKGDPTSLARGINGLDVANSGRNTEISSQSTAISNSAVAGIVNVGGINVSQSIADNVAKMLEAARKDGVSLSGGGYRSNARQIELRKKHCGSSNYAIYQMPSGQCSPPTARPGNSQHEKGLAIDFRNCGRGSGCFRWLSNNAAKYGFYNLPSESWHWSVNGK